jgi:hypothetical protein
MSAYDALPEEPEEAAQRYREEAPPRRQSRRPEPYYPPADPPAYQRRDPYHMAEEVEEPVDRTPSGYRREPQFDDPDDYGDDRSYAAADHEQQMQEPYFDIGEPVTSQDDEFYDDPPRKRGRGGLITAVALIGCAMVGTAGAYGYRTFYATPNGKVPPVITAESTPNKVEVQTGKLIQDRVGDPVLGERVVSREEQPVTIPPGSNRPRVVLPAPGVLPQSVFPPAPPPSAAPPARSAESGASGGETKRIRTVTIRPEGAADPTSRPGAGAPTPGRNVAKSTPTGRNTPLQLDPDVQAQALSPASPPERGRVAAVEPRTTQSLTPPAPRAAAAPASSASSGYLVQVSSQRSEADAQASFRALQTKYPDQLSGYSPVVKRVDLGDKGIYYRALVGPFASSSEASQFCSDLKAAGGQCLVPRN